VTRRARRSPAKDRPHKQSPRAIIDALIRQSVADVEADSILVLLLSGTALAGSLCEQLPQTQFCFWTPEHFFHQALVARISDHRSALADEGSATEFSGDADRQHVWRKGGVEIACSANPPDTQFDAVIFPTLSTGAAELTQELLQTAHQRLRQHGTLLSATDNPKDHWLHKHLQALFDKVTARRDPGGSVYLTQKQHGIRRLRTFVGSAAFRFRDRLLQIETHPGVFSHRSVDGGARALIRSLSADIDGAVPLPGPTTGKPLQIVELGCGSGAVSLAASSAFPEARVLAIDSNARATECTAVNAVKNELKNVETRLTCDADIPDPGTWDLVLANPPYFSDFRISELFLKAGKKSLRPGGAIRIVTKLTEWHTTRMQQLFNEVHVRRFGAYDVISAIRR
jgi:16S rRNA G1207 methylase RsmC